jgi:hypothetical protein
LIALVRVVTLLREISACTKPSGGLSLQAMKYLRLFTACTLLASSGAVAQQDRDAPNWVRIETANEQHALTYIDLKSIRTGNGYRLAWAKEVFEDNPKTVREIHAQYEVDCKDPSARIVRSRIHLQGGMVEERGDIGNWINVLPDDRSGLRALHRAICGIRFSAENS